MNCARVLCGKPLGGSPYTSVRADSIVSGLTFCDHKCSQAEAAVRKQRIRRQTGADLKTRRARDLKRKYKITQEDWEDMYERQEGKCAICLTPFGDKKICTDHSHSNGVVRGLLCVKCNHGIGLLKDDPEILMRAATYTASQGFGLLPDSDRG